METRIPAPQMDIPTLHEPESENKGLFVSWSEQTNVTGYEVYVSGPVKDQADNETQIVRVANSSHKISSINDKPLKNFSINNAGGKHGRVNEGAEAVPQVYGSIKSKYRNMRYRNGMGAEKKKSGRAHFYRFERPLRFIAGRI